MLIPVHLYSLITVVSSVVILLFGFSLLYVAVPPEPEFRNYSRARKALAFSFFILAFSGIYELFAYQEAIEMNNLILFLTLIIASFQAFLFTFSLITLIDIQFITCKRVLFHVIPIFLTATILLATCSNSAAAFSICFIIAIIAYSVQLVYYVWLFNQEYKKYVSKVDNYFSGDEIQRMQWVRRVFFMSLTVGILAFASLFANMMFYCVFVVGYTLFYAYFAMKYINYATIFRQFIPAMKMEQAHEKNIAKETDLLDKIVTDWEKEKKFVRQGITLESLSLELGTNYTYLSRYINSSKKQNFKQWISSLRIEEAKLLLIRHPEKTIQHIGEEVGIANKGSFFRQFMQITGMTPGEYRQKMLKQQLRSHSETTF